MIKISRRQFLHGVTALTVATQLQTYPDSLKAKEALNPKALSEIMEVWQQWQARESLSPDEYLASRGVDLKDKVAIADISRNDFREGNIFEVKGMVLAKTEAAAISVLAEKLVPGIKIT